MAAGQQRIDRRHTALRVPLPFDNQCVVDRNTLFRQRGFVAGEPLQPGGRIQRAGDERDIAMPKLDKVRHRRGTGGLLIAEDAVAVVQP
ncbi:hypothetical protein D3C79_1001860 [compost metagenome]